MTMNKVFERASKIIRQKNDDFCGLTMSYRMSDDFGEDSNPALTTWYVSLEWIDEDEKRHSIANATIHSVDIEMFDWETAVYALDEVDESMLQLALATHKEWGTADRILAVDLVTVDSEYRGHGIAPVLVAEALKRLSYRTNAIAVLEVGCVERQGMNNSTLKEVIRKTSASWKRVGFSKVNVEGDYYSLHWSKFSVPKTATRVMKHLEKKALV